MPQDYYESLQLGRSASPAEIKHAFRRLARMYHPDLNPGDPSAEDRMEDLNRAYEVLSDPAKREEYDRYNRPRAATATATKPPPQTSETFEQARARAGALKRLSPYEILNVSPKATHREIRDAFAGFVSTYGQAAVFDRGAALAYQHIKSAYSLLSNYERRRRYNAEHGLGDPPHPEDDALERPPGVLDGLGDWVWIIPVAFVVIALLAGLLALFEPYWLR